MTAPAAGLDPVAYLELSRRLKRHAPTGTDLAVAPRLRAVPPDPAWLGPIDVVSMHHGFDHMREPELDAVRTVLGPGGHRRSSVVEQLPRGGPHGMTGGRPVSTVAATGSLDDGDDAAGPVLAGEALGDPGGALAVLGLGHGPPYRRGQALGRQPAERLGPRADPERGQPLGPGLPAHRVGREPVAGDLEPGPPVVGPGTTVGL